MPMSEQESEEHDQWMGAAADAFRHGYEEAVDLMGYGPSLEYTVGQKIAYSNGYRKGVTEKVNAGTITLERANELLGRKKNVDAPTEDDVMEVSPFYRLGWNDRLNGVRSRYLTPRASETDTTLYVQGFEAAEHAKLVVKRGAILPSLYEISEAEFEAITVPAEEAEVRDTPAYDPVKIPSHYNSGNIEVANFIADQELNYPRGNVVKYVVRAGKKDPAKELEDLEKAAAYLQMAYNLAQGKPAVVRDPETKEVVWSLFKNEGERSEKALSGAAMYRTTKKMLIRTSEGPYYPN